MHRSLQRRGVSLMSLTFYDVLVFSQKLSPCVLVYLPVNAFGSTLFTLSQCSIVLLMWLRLRPHHGSRARSTALLMFTCVFGLQSYVLVGAASWSTAAAQSPVESWAYAFHAAMFCYVVCCIAWCCGQVAYCVFHILRGPVMAKRRSVSLRKSDLTAAVWIEELARYGDATVSSAMPARPTMSRASLRREQVSVGVSAAGTPSLTLEQEL